MTAWQAARRLLTLIASIHLAGCYDLIASHEPVDMQVIDPRPNFIDRALAHRYSNRYTIADADTPRFGTRIPVWQIEQEANRRFAGDGFDKIMAYLEGQGCERADQANCAYRKVVRQVIGSEETQRRLVTLHFSLARRMPRGCTACISARFEIGHRVTP
ncbi:MAG: hypothetical protein AB7O88_00090 [Reyranellaceae bacterium]